MLKVVYSNDMTQLAGQMAAIQQAQPLAPMQAETIIVQSNELARWLSLLLASQHGIAANLEFPYPSAYIWRLFRKIFDDVPVESTYGKDVLAWRIYQLLPKCIEQPDFAVLTHYLGENAEPLKRFNLAHRLADSFDQYLMYRPDWVHAWEQGDTPHWQGKLWHLLTKDDVEPKHRANLLQQFLSLLQTAETKPEGLPERLSIIGITALPPVFLKLFEAMAQFVDVTLYFLSPSQEYWGDLVDSKKQAAQLTLLDEPEAEIAVGHPLLASLGKQGQEFFEQLQDCQYEAESAFTLPEGDSLLHQLKRDIFQLKNIDLAQDKSVVSAGDDSIQVHSCHSAMREIEVLHDQLLALFESRPDLSPTDIVVMTPDIEQYGPAIDAVFGSQTDVLRIPYSIADCSVRYYSQLVNSFISLLDLPQSRFDVETVLSLLDMPAIQRRFGFDQDALPLIRTWLRDTHTRWGVDGEDKARFDLPASEANTWRAGLDRLLLAYALPQANQPGQLFDKKASFDSISGERAAIMAKLCRFIDVLDCARQTLSREYAASQWQQTFSGLLDTFYEVYRPEDEQALTLIRQTIDKLVSATESAQFNETIPLALLKIGLDSHLEASVQQSRFMGHGVTFCGMVPMRSIPFEVVCLIGMNDASYPRRQPKLGFDLLAKHFRVGDRSRRDDDRYLFLEAILSARSTLYLSYVGASIHDNAKIPPSVLVSDLRDVLNLSYQCEAHDEVWTSLLTEHPLQAFSRRYFNGEDDKLFSYQATHCPPTHQSAINQAFTAPLPEADASWRQVSLSQLIQFFKHPVRYLMTERLGVKLELKDDQLDIREPFQLDGLQAWQLRQQILSAKLNDTTVDDVQDYFEATGVLPQGSVGEHVFEQQHTTVERFLEKLPSLPESVGAQSLDLKLGEFHLSGVLNDLTEQGLFSYRMAKTKGHDLLSAWLQHLVLNIIKPAGITPNTSLITEDAEYGFEPVEDAEYHLTELLNVYWQGLHEPIPLFNQTSYNFAKASLNEKSRIQPDNAMWNTWIGGQYQMGEGEDLYHQQVFADGLPVEKLQQLADKIYTPIQQHIKGHTL